ncbi:MAG TPA: DUF1566 domain-containing protein [Polyangia bacterium]|nr:DUF1566 domain-containing protein [Polyangia bacterium]
MKTIAIRCGAVALVVIVLTSPVNSQDAGPPGPADAPTGRYTYPAAGTAYDTKTQLTWQREVPSVTYTWADAKTHCFGAGATLGGTGWRLPTMKELQTIVDERLTWPKIDPIAFPGTPGPAPGAPAPDFWSSSLLAGSPSKAWFVDFQDGYSSYVDVTNVYYVRCVH